LNSSDRKRILDWDNQIHRLGYEQILGIDSDGSIDDCRRAYYEFALCFHPDTHPEADGETQQALCRIFQRGSEAYRVLTHPGLRLRWHKARDQGSSRLSDLAPPPDLDLALELPRLHERCHSAGAKLEAVSATRAFMRGDTAAATRHLEQALVYDGGSSPELIRFLEALARLPAGG